MTLAKSSPKISLADHSTRVATATAKLLDSPVLVHRLESRGIEVDRKTLRSIGEFVGKYHDAGKANPEWQQAVQNDQPVPPHSHLSALCALDAAQRGELVGPPVAQTASVLAVLHHHTDLTDRNMSPTGDPVTQLNSNPFDSAFKRNLTEAGFPGVRLTDRQVKQFTDRLTTLRTGETDPARGVLTTVLHSALRQADQHVSGGGVPDAAAPPELAASSIELFESLRPFQATVASDLRQRMVGIAGCGEGKTHTALQWARSQVATDYLDRLVIAMPTRVTSDNLRAELTDDSGVQHLPPEDVAVHHSGSDALQYDRTEETSWQSNGGIPKATARKWFRSPVTITTIDHVLATLVNGYKNADIARGNLLRAGVVFDEVHTYDDRLASRLAGAVSHLSALDIPWYVMTATLPDKIRSHHRFDPDVTHVSDGRLTADTPPREPFTITVTDESLTAADVVAASDEVGAQTTLVVKNTVRKAQQLALNLADAVDGEVLYYSSEFPVVDRVEKEKRIRDRLAAGSKPPEPVYLVATQVCELSLDLSADLLMTDLAPLDAVLQRAGRLHRRGIAPTPSGCRETSGFCPQCTERQTQLPDAYECRVYAPLDESDGWYPYAEDRSDQMWTVLERTRAVLEDVETYDFRASLDWLDHVYDEIGGIGGADYERCARQDLLLGNRRAVYDESQGGERLLLRSPDSYRTPVFAHRYELADGREGSPAELWQTIHDCDDARCGLHRDAWTECDEAFQRFAERHTVPVPSWWLSGNGPASEVSSVSLSGRSVTGMRQIDLSYEYRFGIGRDV